MLHNRHVIALLVTGIAVFAVGILAGILVTHYYFPSQVMYASSSPDTSIQSAGNLSYESPFTQVWGERVAQDYLNYDETDAFVNPAVRDRLVEVTNKYGIYVELRSKILDDDAYKRMHALSALFIINQQEATFLSLYAMTDSSKSVRWAAFLELASHYPESPIGQYSGELRYIDNEASKIMRDRFLIWYGENFNANKEFYWLDFSDLRADDEKKRLENVGEE